MNILVVDNSMRDAVRLQELLELEGAEVVLCLDNNTAREVIEANDDDFTAAFVLWDDRELNFVETLALLRHRWPETPVVVMSKEFTYDLMVRTRLLGAKDILQKPVEA